MPISLFCITLFRWWKGQYSKGNWNKSQSSEPSYFRWRAPISVALDAPGTDFNSTVEKILYLRNCVPSKTLIRQFVTFHLYFNYTYMPQQIYRDSDALEKIYKCPKHALNLNQTSADTYKRKHKLKYHINVARELAFQSALTHFIFPSDIELYPSLNLVPQFLHMIAKNISLIKSGRK